MKDFCVALAASAVFLLVPSGVSAQGPFGTGTLIEIPVHTSTAPEDMIDSTVYLAGTDCWGERERKRDAALVADLPDRSRVVIGFCTNGEKKFAGVFPCSISHVPMLTKSDGSWVFLEPSRESSPHRYSGEASTVKFTQEVKDGKRYFRIQSQNAAIKERIFLAFQPPFQIRPFSEEKIRSLCGTNKLSPGMTKKNCLANKDSVSSAAVSHSTKSE
jgi:hypothetical protein